LTTLGIPIIRKIEIINWLFRWTINRWWSWTTYFGIWR
jgi:hypothetical protein